MGYVGISLQLVLGDALDGHDLVGLEVFCLVDCPEGAFSELVVEQVVLDPLVLFHYKKCKYTPQSASRATGCSTHVSRSLSPAIEKHQQEQTINSVEDFGSYVDNPIQGSQSQAHPPSSSHRDEHVEEPNFASLESNNDPQDDDEPEEASPPVRITNLKPFIKGAANSSYLKDNQSQASYVTNPQQQKRQKKKIKIYSFYYDLQANAKTSIFS